ncbi:AAA domain-containing protein [Tengunoibacter tsumagoiensis]|uniref:DNA helicase n=1 Tax=Tengunoibacter tsumagoiensis TaxID=2014871 RepID=A0A402A453_9CHLR|nr:AAA domain-containing protein [Tengunoibacter tsumagoiensis]GCE13934.1 ATPase AAA [Tengunoibacter tsumagoiensis]
MVTHDANVQHDTKQGCFLCSLDPSKQHCQAAQLSGRIVTALERQVDNERIPILILDTGSQQVELLLDRSYYRSLINEIKARGDVVGSYQLTLQVYHLPYAPEVIEYPGRTRLRYRTNAYTLAVLEPDILLNITDLNQAEYCGRQYTLKRLLPSTSSPATIRGNLIHHAFKELLKEHDRQPAQTTTGEENAGESALQVLQRHFTEALDLSLLEMALADIQVETMREEVAPHLESLAHWYEHERNTLWDLPASYTDQVGQGDNAEANQVRAETFLLAPEIGLRGRLDLFWQQSGRQRLLELKTGGAKGNLPQRDHRWQVYGYHALLTVRRDSQMKKALATLLYSGTPSQAQAFGIPATIREIQRVNETRNLLVLSRVTQVPPAPPGPSRCTRCSLLEHCQSISSMLDWPMPEPDFEQLKQRQQATPHASVQHTTLQTSEEKVFFQKYYRLLQLEGREGEKQQATLWKTTMRERLELGMSIQGLEPLERPQVEKDGWRQDFRCTNTSELREGDEILLSDGNPISGEVVTGTIMRLSSEQISIWTRELIAHPTSIDRYDNDLVHMRTLQNLWRWQQATPHLRDLVAGKIRPRFKALSDHQGARSDFNAEQNLAVERALQMQDYLLIQGPPGTGKTSVIAEIVKRLVAEGQRVMLVAFTNQAVDNMLKRLEREGFQQYLRLGHERSVDEYMRPHLLKELVEQALADPRTTAPRAAFLRTAVPTDPGTAVREILFTMPVVASTTATWSSDKYIPQSVQNGEDLTPNGGLSFDVAIIDEAGQLTIPALLGALRFTKRFILVGDEKQLPPLVLSKEAAEAGLAISLFSQLKQWDEDYMQAHPLSISACVPLRTQYRMNKWIANFSSRVFYDNLLQADRSIANRTLSYQHSQRLLPSAETAITRALKPEWPLVFLDVREETFNPEGKLSIIEAETIRELVATLLSRGIPPHEIGIIAPYRAQVANIRRHLFSAFPPLGWEGLSADTPLSVDTVDRFQGGERSVIIMSFATNQEPALESPRRDFLINGNRLNVALTRAQRKLILVGNARALENLPIFSRLITYCRSMNTLITSH